MYLQNEFHDVKSWEKNMVEKLMPYFGSKGGNLPHIIIAEIHANDAEKIKNKPQKFKIGEAEYVLDSAVCMDIQKQHFCAMITCEGKQMAFDGYSYHRLTASEWKDKINSSDEWEFEGTENEDGSPMKWSFLRSYQMLMYYRVI